MISSSEFFDRTADSCFFDTLNCLLRNRWLSFESGFGLRSSLSSEWSLFKEDFLPIAITKKSIFSFLPAILIAWDICVVTANLSKISVSIFFESMVLVFFAWRDITSIFLACCTLRRNCGFNAWIISCLCLFLNSSKKSLWNFLSKSMSNISTFDCATENWILREEPPCMIGMILISSLLLSFVS